MARIVKRKVQHGKPYECRWSWYDDEGARRFGQERFRTLGEAKAKRREVEQAVADANLPDASGGKEQFGAWAERWFRTHQIGLKPSTIRSYRSLLDRSVLPRFGVRRVRSISTADVQGLGHRASGARADTERRFDTTPSPPARCSPSRRGTEPSPTTRRRTSSSPPTVRPGGRSRRCTSWTRGRSRHWPARWRSRTACSCCSRRTRGCGLASSRDSTSATWTCCTGSSPSDGPGAQKIKGGWEVHTPKSGKTRQVPLTVWLADDLRAYLERHPRAGEPDAPLWPGRVNGGAARFAGGAGGITYDQPWERDAFLKRPFKPALVRAGLPAKVRLHDLRHSYISIGLSLGIPAYRLATYAGHSMQVMHSTYAHLLHRDRADDMERLARPVAVATPSTAELPGPLASPS